jgi:hypothetical protein
MVATIPQNERDMAKIVNVVRKLVDAVNNLTGAPISQFYASSTIPLEINSPPNSISNITLSQWSANTSVPFLTFTKSRGSIVGSYCSATSGDGILYIHAASVNSVGSLADAGIIKIDVAAAPTTSGVPGKMTFFTSDGTSSTPIQRQLIDNKGNVVINTNSVSSAATDGFLYLTTCASAPTGTPTTYAGRSALLFDTVNNKLWAYNGAWKGVVLS